MRRRNSDTPDTTELGPSTTYKRDSPQTPLNINKVAMGRGLTISLRGFQLLVNLSIALNHTYIIYM
jgi:hypothetical protein